VGPHAIGSILVGITARPAEATTGRYHVAAPRPGARRHSGARDRRPHGVCGAL